MRMREREKIGVDRVRRDTKRSGREASGQRGRRGRAAFVARTRNFPRAEKRKISWKWLTPDSFMGKVLCILLVLILTVGAFLAPKLIGNLYDAGTLSQISYMDMDLSPYAVNYLTVEDKLQAIARVKTAGGSLSVLPAAEDDDDRTSDQALAEAVNKEIDALNYGLNIFFRESWWSTLTEENLVSRTKYTLYGRPEEGEEDASQEMAPFQLWVLQFARTEAYDEARENNKYLTGADYVTDRLIVCMDADFYKIYGVAFAGNEEMIRDLYGWWDLPEIFAVDGGEAGFVNAASVGGDMRGLRIDLTAQILGEWADYWDTTPGEQPYYLDIKNELAGTFVYRSGEGEEAPEEEETDANAVSIEVVDIEGNTISLSEEEEKALAVEQAARYAEEGQGIVYAYQTGELMILPEEDIENLDFRKEGDMLLIVGAKGQEVWDEADFPVWIQKMGCRDFFELMQF